MKHISEVRTGACWRVPLGREGVRRIPENQGHFHQTAQPGSCYGRLPCPITLQLARLRGCSVVAVATDGNSSGQEAGGERAAWSCLRSSSASAAPVSWTQGLGEEPGTELTGSRGHSGVGGPCSDQGVTVRGV